MSNTITVITAKKFKGILNDEKIDINYCRFVAMANDVYDTLRYNENNRATQAYKRAINGYDRIINKPLYFMAYPYDSKDWEGSVVYATPKVFKNQTFDGVFDEYDLDNIEVVGTLIRKGNKKHIETDLVEIEQIRRKIECDKIKSGKCTIYFTDVKGDLQNPDKYFEYLEDRDKKHGRYITRGHGNI